MSFKAANSFLLPYSVQGETLSKSVSKMTFSNVREFLNNSRYKVEMPNSQRAEEIEKSKVLLKQIQNIREDLEIPNHFRNLPDGTWALFATKQIDDNQFVALVSALTTLVLTAKYNMSTWHHALLDYAIDSVEHFTSQCKDYQATFKTILMKRVPIIAIGTENFKLDVLNISEPKVSKTMKQTLSECLRNTDKLLIICRNYTCLLVKRYNFYYLYSGYPTNNAGYRRFSKGAASILRFMDLDGLIRRIDFGCNQDGSKALNYIVVSFKITNLNNTLVSKVTKPVVDAVFKETKKDKTDKTDRAADKHNVKPSNDSLLREKERVKRLYAKKTYATKRWSSAPRTLS